MATDLHPEWQKEADALATYVPNAGAWKRQAEDIIRMRAAMQDVITTFLHGRFTPESFQIVYDRCIEVDAILQGFDAPTDAEGNPMTREQAALTT